MATDQAFYFDGLQIEAIIDKLAPLIARPEDQEFFRGVLFVKAENSTSGEFALFVNRLLKFAGALDDGGVRG